VSRTFAGTFALARLALRRDRWILPSWIAFFVFMAASSAAATAKLYPSAGSRAAAAATLNATAALVALYGRVYDPTSLGALSLIKLTAFGAALVGILMVFVVVRHTRAEEESGRVELVAAGVVGRDAPLAAAFLVALGASATLGLATALGLRSAGLPMAGSVTFGLGWALTGLSFASIAALAAQLTVGSRAARGLALSSIAVAYALRAAGDLAGQGPGWASWLSPIGWSQQLRPFAGNRWWVVALPLALIAVTTPAAFALRARRDLGSGLLPDRPGPARGSMATAAGLAWRLQRGSLTAWAVGVAMMGFLLGAIAHNVLGLLASPQMRRFFEALGGARGLLDGFLAAEVGILGSVIAAYGVAACARLRAEESAGHVEVLLSTATTRGRFAAGHLGVALAGVAALLVTTGTSIGLGHGVATGDYSQVARVAGAAAAHVPAAWVMTGLVFALFGWAPRAVPASWGVLAAFIAWGEFGVLWGVPKWLLATSPFAHSPRLPGGPVHAGSLVALVGVTAALAAFGFIGWRRRDLAA
jgi:ABC-2 type transport system permease protein